MTTPASASPSTTAHDNEAGVSVTSLELREELPGSHIYVLHEALSLALCDELIEQFEARPQEHYAGVVGQQATRDLSVKCSTDLALSGKAHWGEHDRRLFQSLKGAMRAMQQRSSFFGGAFKDTGYGLQRTAAGEFYHWHVDGGSHDFADRQLVAIWYLNDVAGPGGETEFLHQGLKIQPERGKLILFPPFWTHEHRGVTLHSGVKYIATTWVCFA